MFTRIKIALILFVLASGLLLTACGSPAATPATGAAPTTTPATKAPAPNTPLVVATTAPSLLATATLPPTDLAVEATAAPEVPAVTKLNLNTATGDEFLAGVPGMSARMVREFQEYRPYVSIQQFRREIGKYVDQSQVAEYEKFVFVPIDVNNSDAATLQQITGLEAAEADSLIAKRPFASNEAFLTELAQYLSESEVALAATYLAVP